jgi:plasmid stabilization system protein ParE
MNVLVTSRAERDVDAIYESLAQKSKETAIRWYHAFLASLRSLSVQSEACGAAVEAEMFGADLRQVLFTTRMGRVYRSIFVIKGNDTHVVGVRGMGGNSENAKPADILKS